MQCLGLVHPNIPEDPPRPFCLRLAPGRRLNPITKVDLDSVVGAHPCLFLAWHESRPFVSVAMRIDESV